MSNNKAKKEVLAVLENKHSELMVEEDSALVVIKTLEGTSWQRSYVYRDWNEAYRMIVQVEPTKEELREMKRW